ncbi:MAG: FMN-dependent NADH-azoreductase, partial [Mesorhizobium sp.]
RIEGVGMGPDAVAAALAKASAKVDALVTSTVSKQAAAA